MPIGGFVVTVIPGKREEVKKRLARVEACDVFQGEPVDGAPKRAQNSIVITLETDSSDQMEELVANLKDIDGVLSVDLAYLNVEDEVDE